MTRAVLKALTDDPNNYAPGAFPDAPFPEPVLALYHQFFMTSTYEDIDYWEHFASQSAIEMTIYSVVSTSVLPGVVVTVTGQETGYTTAVQTQANGGYLAPIGVAILLLLAGASWTMWSTATVALCVVAYATASVRVSEAPAAMSHPGRAGRVTADRMSSLRGWRKFWPRHSEVAAAN